MSAAGQGRVFAAMMLCGMMIGAVHDLLGLIRRNAWMTAAADLALGIFAAAGVIAAALYLRCDAFRLYIFAGVLLGWVIYALTLGLIVRMLHRNFINLSKNVTN